MLQDIQDSRYANNVFALPHVANLTCDPKTCAQIFVHWDYISADQIKPGFMGKDILKRHHGQVLWRKHVFLMSVAAKVPALDLP